MMKGQKGITLVALIITIIVMLILVAVTISIALNGGLFDKARTASRETRIAQVNEAIALAKADIVADFYDPTNKPVSNKPADGHAVYYLQPNAADPELVQNAINGYLDTSVIMVNKPTVERDNNGITKYTVTISNKNKANETVNSDIAGNLSTLTTLELDIFTTN